MYAIRSYYVDPDGSESLAVVISAVPVGATLTDGTNTFTATVGTTSVDVSAWTLALITVQAPANSDSEFALTVTATATEATPTSTDLTVATLTASTVQTIAVRVDAVADAPNLAAFASVTTNEDSPVNLGLSASLVDPDGSESLAVVISAVPVGATLTDGTNTFV